MKSSNRSQKFVINSEIDLKSSQSLSPLKSPVLSIYSNVFDIFNSNPTDDIKESKLNNENNKVPVRVKSSTHMDSLPLPASNREKVHSRSRQHRKHHNHHNNNNNKSEYKIDDF